MMPPFLLVAVAAAGHFFCLIGLGHLAASSLRINGKNFKGDFLRDFWLGFAALLLLLQWWHLCLPIDWKANLAIGGLGLFGLLRRLYLADKAECFWTGWIPGFALGGALLIYLLIVAVSPIRNYDSGLYHFNAIRWANEYAIVPGIVNLHSRLAFNQTQFPFIAFLNGLLPFRMGHNLGNLVVFSALALEAARAVAKWYRAPAEIRPIQIYWSLMLPLLAFLLNPANSFVSQSISSPSPDPMIFALGIAVFARLVEVILPGDDHAETTRSNLATLLVLASAAVTMKLSFVVFAATSIGVALYFGRREQTLRTIKSVLPAFIFSAAMGLTWGIRGIISSGYPAYPLTLGAFPCDWRLSPAAAHLEKAWIESWAKAPGLHPSQVLGNWTWLDAWLKRPELRLDVTTPLMFSLVVLAGYGLARMLLKKQPENWRPTLPLIPLLAAAWFWFVTAPDPRFAGSIFWCVTAWTITFVGNSFLPGLTPKTCRTAVFTLAAAGVLLPLSYWFPKIMIQPVQVYGIPRHPMREFRADSGLTVFVPIGEPVAWDSPLPSTPYPAANLRLRGDGLQSGFILDSTK